MTVKGINANSKPSVFTLDDASFSTISHNNCGSDVNLNHLSMTNPSHTSQIHGFSPNSSPTREQIETQKSIVHLKEKNDERYVIESTAEMTKIDEMVSKSSEKDFDKTSKEVFSLILIELFMAFLVALLPCCFY